MTSCATCPYLLSHPTMGDRGYCRRFPPPGLIHPMVYKTNLCGEHPDWVDPVIVSEPETPSDPEPSNERVKAPRRKKYQRPAQPEMGKEN